MRKVAITVENINEFRPIAKEIDKTRLNPFIQEAHQIDLKNLLGKALWLDFLTKFDNSGATEYADYQKLLNGSTYLNGTVTIENPGLIGYLSYCTLARFYEFQPVNVSRFGMVQKINDNSQPIDSKMMASTIETVRSIASSLASDIRLFLTTNISKYPLYSDVLDMKDTGQVKFFDADGSYNKFYGGGSSRNGRTNESY